MHMFDGWVKDLTPPVFCPKVTPDPLETERLEAKLREATQRLHNSVTKNFARRAFGLQQVSG